MAELNKAQKEAVEIKEGPALVLAGAGTGKTRVVTFRIANLIKDGVDPERILAVTFTNKAALEMKQRIGELLPARSKKRPVVGTFHSICLDLLRRHIHLLGYPKKFAIYDRGDQESLARRVLREISISTEKLKPTDLLFRISRWKTGSITPQRASSTAQTDKEHLAASAYRRYQRDLKNSGAVDFDDLLLLTQELFRDFEEVRLEESKRFDFLLVDEYQDTNSNQYDIVSKLAQDHRNLFVVGDDDQSIYGWRGAEVEHILRFDRDWPGCRVIRLEENYRSTEEILILANRLIKFNRVRHDKELKAGRSGGLRPSILQYPNEAKEAEETVRQIKQRLSLPGVSPNDFAILFRTNEQPRPFEAEFRKQKIPYVLLGGTSFFDKKEVRDILAYLKVFVSTKDDVSMLRVVNTPPRGIGPTAQQAIRESAVKVGEPIWKAIADPALRPSLAPKSARSLETFRNLVEQYRAKFRNGSLADTTRQLIASIGYYAELDRLYPNPEERQSRLDTVEQIVNAIAEYERETTKPTLYGFLDTTALDGMSFDNEKEKKLKNNAVMMLTMHSAKGLEFPEVYLVGMEDGILPHRRSVELGDGDSIDEERRLCYVGITRAQERLTLSLSLTRLKWGKARDTVPSRFLFEMTGQAENRTTRRSQRKTRSV